MHRLTEIKMDMLAAVRKLLNKRKVLGETVVLQRARADIEHRNASGKLLWKGHAHNLITNAGRDFLHQQGYAASGLGTVGLCYIALSNDTVGETASSTTLSTEITTNGLGRAVGTVAHTAGTNTSTISRTFTASGTQSAQKAALFTASSAGTMNHVLSFTQRNLISGDTLAITFTITLG